MKFSTAHIVMALASVAAIASEVLGQYVAAGSPLPFHITAATALALVTLLGGLSKSVLEPKAPDSK